MLTMHGFSFAKFKEYLRHENRLRKLEMFENIEKQLVNRDLLESFFNKCFSYQPSKRLRLK